MKIKIKKFSFIVIILSIFFSLTPNPIAISQTEEPNFKPDDAYLTNGRDATFNYIDLIFRTNLWADGTGDVIIEQLVENLSIENWTGFTWNISFGPDLYSNVRAWDNQGPLNITTTPTENGISVTIDFRENLQINHFYRFSLALSIENIASGSGENWEADWSVQTSTPVDRFINSVTFPANATITSVSPDPTYQYLNYLEWIGLFVPSDTLFSFESTYILSTNILVPLYLQGQEPWFLDTYGNYPNGDTYNTIKRWGCNMSSAAMILDYWGQRSPNVFRTDPRDLNAWLRSNSGYTPGNGVIYSKVVEYARSNGVNLTFDRLITSRNDTILDNYLKSGNPVVLGVKPIWSDSRQRYIPGHYVVATGKTEINGVPTYTINDPYYGQTTLAEKWNNSYQYLILYSGTAADLSKISISAHSPVELLVTDSLGRRTGYDPINDVYWNEIPGAVYYNETLATNETGGGQLPESKILLINSPIEGNYQIQVIGTGTGDYTISSVASNWLGSTNQSSFTGSIEQNLINEETISYSYELGLFNSIFLPIVRK